MISDKENNDGRSPARLLIIFGSHVKTVIRQIRSSQPIIRSVYLPDGNKARHIILLYKAYNANKTASPEVIAIE